MAPVAQEISMVSTQRSSWKLTRFSGASDSLPGQKAGADKVLGNTDCHFNGSPEESNGDDTDDNDVTSPNAKRNNAPSQTQKRKFTGQESQRQAVGEVTLSDDAGGDSSSSRKRLCGKPSSSSVTRARPRSPVKVIDLTVDIEHCALCSNILGRGDGYIARMFAFTTCECVLCGECLLGNIQEQESESSSVIKGVWCPKSDHFNQGEQEACQIFGLACGICYATSVDEIDQGIPHGSDLFRTSCGHTFCRRCIRRWAAQQRAMQQRANKCPNCRSILRKGYCRFKTIKRGLVSNRLLVPQHA